ncbi:MAG: hypothetical protein ACREJG_07810 [Candidatus Rokuibacteriota bacterium]
MDREARLPATSPWTPPIWLRQLRAAALDHRRATPPTSPTGRFRLACVLMEFARKRLEEQARERRCSVGELLVVYEQATRRLRARG